MRDAMLDRFRWGAAWLLAALALTLTCGVAPARALAAPTGSIALVTSAERPDGSKTPLAGDGYALYAVAEAEVDGDGIHYETLEPFGPLDCDWPSLTAAELREAAHAARDIAEAQKADVFDELVTDAAGRAASYGLAPGVYLLVRTDVAQANADVVVDPMLVGIPTLVDGVPTYDVTAHPKFELEKPPAGGDPEPGAPGNPGAPGGIFPGLGMPSTGDIQMMLVGLLLIAGVAVLWLSRRVSGSGDASAASADGDAREQD